MAIKYYAGNRLTGVSGDTKPTTLPTGATFLETNTDDLYMWDGDSWNIVASNAGTETLSNKTFSDHITIAEISAPSTPASGYGAIYFKSDNKLYFKNDAGTEVDVTIATGSGTLTVTDNESTNENNLIPFVADAATATGTHGLEMDGNLHYNPSTGTVTATTFVGALTGNVSGDVTGSAGSGMTGDVAWTSASFDGSGNVTGTSAITADVIINADVKSDAAIAYSKLAALSDGNILVGNGSNVATSVNPSGDIDISNAGVFSISSDVIIDADVKSDAAIAMSKTALVAGTGIT